MLSIYNNPKTIKLMKDRGLTKGEELPSDALLRTVNAV